MEDLTIRKKFDRKVLHLVYVGRIDLAKGLKEIVRALESMADISYYFHIVGDGPDMPEFTKILSALPEANYKLYGVKTLDEIYKILAGCQVFIMPSYYEGLPNAMLEAMANCVVPIVTPVGSIPEVVSEENGYLVSVKSPLALQEAIRNAYENKEGLYSKALAGRRLMLEDFSIDRYASKLNELYDGLIAE